MLILLGLALVVNSSGVAAANSTNLTTVKSANLNLVSDSTTLNATSKVVKTSVTSVNTYGLSLAQITDGLIRAQKFYDLNNRLPNYVSFGTKKVLIANFERILTAKGLKLVCTSHNNWATIKNLVYYHQTTGYTCGPSSLKMVLSDYGMNLSEMSLASYAGSNPNTGSTETGLINAVNKVDIKYGTHYRSYKESLSSEGWRGLYSYISLNYPVILHIKSFLDPNSGHYVVLTRINLKLKQVTIADPSYGYRTLTFSQISSRINWVVSTGRSSKPLTFVINN